MIANLDPLLLGGRPTSASSSAQATKRNRDSRATAFQKHTDQGLAASTEKILPKKFTAPRSESLTEW